MLNWTIGPALLGAGLASFGCEPKDPPSVLEFLRAIAGIAGFFAGGGLILGALAIVGHRLIEGRFNGPEIRQVGAMMAVKIGMLVFALTLILGASALAMQVFGSWQAGWLAALVGAGIGAAIGLPAGLFIAWLKIPQRLGLK